MIHPSEIRPPMETPILKNEAWFRGAVPWFQMLSGISLATWWKRQTLAFNQHGKTMGMGRPTKQQGLTLAMHLNTCGQGVGSSNSKHWDISRSISPWQWGRFKGKPQTSWTGKCLTSHICAWIGLNWGSNLRTITCRTAMPWSLQLKICVTADRVPHISL